MRDEGAKDYYMPADSSEPHSFEMFKEISAEAFIDRYDTKKLILGIKRHVLTIIVTLVLGAVLGTTFASILLNTYKADAVVIYQEETKPQTLPGGYAITTLSIATVLDMIKLPVNFQAVKSILGLDLTPTELEGMIDVPTPRANSNLIHIIARGENPHLVVDLVNTLAKVSVKSSQEFYQKQLQAALQSYTEQLDANNKKLAFQLQEIENFKKENQYFEMTADYAGLLKMMADTRNRLQSVSLQYNSLLVEYENMKREVANLPDEVPVSSSYVGGYHYSPLETHLGSLQASLAEARAKYTSDNPKVKQIEEELDNLLKKTRQRGSVEQAYEWNTDKTKLQIDLLKMEGKVRAALKTKQDLTANVAKLERQLEELPAKQISLGRLLQAQQTIEAQQKFLQNAIESVQLMLNIPSGSIDLYSLADKARPLRDSWWVQILPLFGMIFGMGCGIAVAIMLEMWDNKCRTAKEIELYYTLPCLGVIPVIPHLTRVNGDTKTLYYIRQLHERLEKYNVDGSVKSIAFTSTINDEGKSLLSYYYALYCKKIGQKVMLIESTPKSSAFTEGKSTTSLESYLKGSGTYQSLIFHGAVDSIQMIEWDPAMKELIKSDKMKTLWADLYLEYDIVIIDAPGVLNEEYAINLVHLTELSVFIVNSSLITKPLLDQALGVFEHFHVKPTGILLNNVLPVYIDDERMKLEKKKSKKFFRWD